jgi:dihydroxyacetone kinase-like protein
VSCLSAALRAAAEAVLERAAELNRLDAQAGDGDLGITMSAASQAVIELLPDQDGQPPAEVLRTCGAALAREAPSTCGTLVATGLLRAARAAAEELDADAVARLLEAARAGIAERGKAELGQKTMLDALAPAAAAAAGAAAEGAGGARLLAAAAAAAEAGAASTVSMVPRHGRAGWLAERSAGHEDAGARLVAIVLAAAASSLEPEARGQAAG